MESLGASQVRSTAYVTPVPLSAITVVAPLEELLASDNCPVAAPVAVGSNWRFSVAVCPGLRVSGKVTPLAEKPVPATVAELSVTGAVPEDVRVIDWVAGVLRFTSPNAIVVALTLSVGVPVFNCNAKVADTPASVAVRVTLCAVVTAETVAVKPPVVAPAATVTLAGTLTDVLLLARLTARPPDGAAALRATVQLSVPAPVMEALEQVTALNAAVGARVKANVFEMLPAVAVSVADCAVVTAVTVAVKVAVLAPAETVILAGIVTEVLLLESVTASPPLGAAALNVTVQLSVPAPVMEALEQVSALRAAVGVSCTANVLETPLKEAVRVAA